MNVVVHAKGEGYSLTPRHHWSKLLIWRQDVKKEDNKRDGKPSNVQVVDFKKRGAKNVTYAKGTLNKTRSYQESDNKAGL